MLKLSAIALVLTMMAPLSAIAYTQEDADACTPDAMRLCQKAIPDAQSRSALPCPEQTATQPRLRCCV